MQPFDYDPDRLKNITRLCMADGGSATNLLSIQASQFPGAHEDAGKHGAIEAAGVGIAQRGMIAAQQVQAIGQHVLGAMGEACSRSGVR